MVFTRSSKKFFVPHCTQFAWLALALFASLLHPVWAQTSVKAKTKAEITVSGLIGFKNAGDVALVDMKMVRSLPQRSFTTYTPWHQEKIKFTGPLLRDVLEYVKVKGKNLDLQAIDGYKITIPVSDAYNHEVILAHTVNDKPLTIRSRGPLRIVYNYDSEAQLRSSKFYERSIWSIKFMDVR